MPLDTGALKTDAVPLGSVAALADPPSEAPALPWHLRFFRELAIHDWIVVTYLTILTIAVAFSPPTATHDECLAHVIAMLGFCLAMLVLVRGGLLRDHFFAPFLYRLGVYRTLPISDFALRELLPLVNSSSLD